MPEINDREGGKGGGAGSPLTYNKIWKGNASNVAEEAALPAGTGDVIAPATNTANNVPQWDGANSKTLKDGLAVGTAANNLVQLDGSARLPAVDGSQLTNLPVPDLSTKQDKVLPVVAGENVVAGTLGRLYNDAGTLKVKKVTKTRSRQFLNLTESTTNTLSEIVGVAVGGIHVYAYRGASGYPYVQAFDIASGVSIGTAVILTSNSSTALSIATDGTGFVVSYLRGGQVYAVACTLSGTTITAGDETIITNQTATYSNCLAWDSNASRYCLLCTGTPSGTNIQTMTVSATTISLNAVGNVATGLAAYATPSLIFDSTVNKLVFIGSNAITTHYVRHCTVTAGNPDTFEFSTLVNIENPKASGIPLPVAKLVRAYNKTYVLINTQNLTTANERRVKLYEITISSNTTVSTDQNITVDMYGIQKGSASYIEAVYDEYLDMFIVLINNQAALAWKIIPLRLVGDVWNREKIQYVQYVSTYSNAKCSTLVYDNSNKVTSAILQLDGTSGVQQGYFFSNLYEERAIGDCVIQETKNSGETTTIAFRGDISAGFTGLTPGNIYYWQDDATAGLALSNTIAGKSLSATQIKTTEGDNEVWY